MSRIPNSTREYRSPSSPGGGLAFSPSATGPLLSIRKFILTALVLASVSTLLLCAQTPQPTQTGKGASHIVTIKQMHFDPAQIKVQAGDTVEWKNDDIFAHTITANDGSFDSGLIDPGHSWQKTFTTTQTVAYHCRPHPNMRATLSVQAASGHGSETKTGGTSEQGATLKWSPPTTPEEFHPILVNFTAALLPLALLSDILGRLFRRRSFHHAAWWMVLYAALITPLTAAAGWWWKRTAGADLPQRLITVHQWLGTSAVLLFAVLAVWRWRIHKRDASPGLAYLAFALVAVLALVYQGSLGGRMVFGQ
jgi:plastocyanin/uncharacterized membrane protein